MATAPIPFGINPFNVGTLPPASMQLGVPFSAVSRGLPLPQPISPFINPYQVGGAGFGINPYQGPALSALQQRLGPAGPSTASRLAKFFVPQTNKGLIGKLGPALKGSGALAKGARLAGPALVGQAASWGIKKALPGSSKLEQILSGGATGAGLGALVGGGVPGAVVGGIAGGIGGALFGAPKQSAAKVRPVDQLRGIIQEVGMDPQQSKQYIKLYSLLNKVGGDTPQSREESANSVISTIVQEIQAGGFGQEEPGGYGYNMSVEDNAAIQAQTANFLAPYTQQTIDSAKLASDAVMANINNVPAEYRGVLETGAKSQLAATTRLANAYAAQAMLAPQAYAIQQQQQEEQAIARQIRNQAIQQQLAGSAQPEGDFQALLNQGMGQ